MSCIDFLKALRKIQRCVSANRTTPEAGRSDITSDNTVESMKSSLSLDKPLQSKMDDGSVGGFTLKKQTSLPAPRA